MAVIHVDNKPYEIEEGRNLLATCLSLGLNIPYFCWHPALHSVGSCRLCAVKLFRDESDTRGQIIMSCMTEVADGCRISINDPEVREFRAAVIQWLMMSHPHDCPVCDEGGECHLQDMTVMTGHTYRKYRFKKTTYRNQHLGPFIHHEMNRCIKCYRCVRFYRDYAGGRDLNVFGIHGRLYFGRFDDGVLENEFSGNLVEVCPTGVFTDATLRRHYTRKWDLQTAPSVCVHCGVGCNVLPGERYGVLRRIQNRFNHEVNGYFLCDRGRFGYEFVNHHGRIRTCSVRKEHGQLEIVPGPEALKRAAETIAACSRVIGIGSPRASLESNFVLRTLVGKENFYSGMSRAELHLVRTAIEILRKGPVPARSLHGVEKSDGVLVLGEDVSNTAPRAALSLRQAVRIEPMRIARRLNIPEWNDRSVRQALQDEKGPLFVCSTGSTRLDEIARETFRGPADEIARVGFAVAHEIDRGAPAVPDLGEELRPLVVRIARALKGAARPLVVSGTGCGTASVIEAAANVAWALVRSGQDAGLFLALPECNTLGVSLIGGDSIEAAFKEVREGRAETVVIVENDVFRRCGSETAEGLLESAKHVIVIDHIVNACAQRAHLILPAATFAEGQGTFVSNEGRAQRFFRVFQPAGEIRESWRWLRDLTVELKRPEAHQLATFDAIVSLMAAALPVFKDVPNSTPNADWRGLGQEIPRQAHRFSGRTAILANVTVHEPAPPQDTDSPLAFSMEGFQGVPPSALISRFWAPGWNSVQALNKFQSEVGGPLIGGDPGKRLIEPSAHGEIAHFTGVPAAFQRRPGQWLVVAVHHIFGSEELSLLSPGIAELAPRPYLGLNPRDAEALGIREGDLINVRVEKRALDLPARLDPSLPGGFASLPVGMPGLEGIGLPAWGTVIGISKGTDT